MLVPFKSEDLPIENNNNNNNKIKSYLVIVSVSTIYPFIILLHCYGNMVID